MSAFPSRRIFGHLNTFCVSRISNCFPKYLPNSLFAVLICRAQLAPFGVATSNTTFHKLSACLPTAVHSTSHRRLQYYQSLLFFFFTPWSASAAQRQALSFFHWAATLLFGCSNGGGTTLGNGGIGGLHTSRGRMRNCSLCLHLCLFP